MSLVHLIKLCKKNIHVHVQSINIPICVPFLENITHAADQDNSLGIETESICMQSSTTGERTIYFRLLLLYVMFSHGILLYTFVMTFKRINTKSIHAGNTLLIFNKNQHTTEFTRPLKIDPLHTGTYTYIPHFPSGASFAQRGYHHIQHTHNAHIYTHTHS